jgi:HAE1 family hydrophobic/amphiphilic exporter-1
MKLVDIAIRRPVAVVAAVFMVLLLGIVALTFIPIQLIPDLRKPIVTVTTSWRGGAPAEVEREIVNRQEERFKGLEGLEKITSRSENGRAEITLEFDLSRSMDRTLLLVANRLDQITGYPDEADEPTIKTSSSEDRPIAWFILTLAPGNESSINDYGDFARDVLQDRLERVSGVSRVNVFGGSERELRIIVDPGKMASYSLTVPMVLDRLRQANVTISAGNVDEGKRRYTVRTEGELVTPELVSAVLLRSETNPQTGRIGRVTVGEIAEVGFHTKEPLARIRYLGQPAIAINVVRETGANVMEAMAGIRQAAAELNKTAVPTAGAVLQQVYDETVYIDSAIDLVQQNILVGGAFAVFILLLFLRSPPATLIVSAAIPISVIGSFVAMAAMGRSINVISLAGIAFAVGMVVDAAIVVLENIFRLRERGDPLIQAASVGAKQVWGAVLVSALTTILVFVPILIMREEVGQLFRDIAVAISVSVMLSLIVAITVIPALAYKLLGRQIKHKKLQTIPFIDRFASRFVEMTVNATRRVIDHRGRSLAVVLSITAIAAASTYLFLPKLEYLPEGNRNLVFGVILPPPGYNLDTTTAIAERIEATVRPHWASVTGAESEPGEPVKMSGFFFVAMPSSSFLGSTAVDPVRANEMVPVLKDPIFNEPGAFGFVTQTSLFARASTGARSVRLDISGPDLEAILKVAGDAARRTMTLLPFSEGHQMQPIPGLELGAPEIRVIPDHVRLADAGVTTRELGLTIDAFNDGLRVDEITVNSRRIDLTLQGPRRKIVETQGIGNLPVVTRSGLIVPVSSLARVEVTSGPTEIRHLDRERTVTLEIRPATYLPLQTMIEMLEEKVMAPMRENGLPPGIKLNLSGTADELTKAWNAMVLNLILAVLLVYLIMAILFESFIYPIVIMLSVPLATAGGVGGYLVLNLFTFQPFDMLTLLGFVILIGIVVNNAILLVHQTLVHLREEGMEMKDAIVEATRNRIRPIFMSSLTSIGGMLPLILFPGAGSELYRGLGSVIVGGLALSAVLTLTIIPPMLILITGWMSGRDSGPRARLTKTAE